MTGAWVSSRPPRLVTMLKYSLVSFCGASRYVFFITLDAASDKPARHFSKSRNKRIRDFLIYILVNSRKYVA